MQQAERRKLWNGISTRTKNRRMKKCICTNGKIRNIEYDHAVLVGDNYYEGGKWYIHGHLEKGMTVLAWMELPEPYREE